MLAHRQALLRLSTLISVSRSYLSHNLRDFGFCTDLGHRIDNLIAKQTAMLYITFVSDTPLFNLF